MITTIIAALAIIAGLVLLFDHNFMWEITTLINLAFKLESERTRTWDLIVSIGGALLLAFGVILLILSW